MQEAMTQIAIKSKHCRCHWYFFYLSFSLAACQVYFTLFEPSQTKDGAKTGDPQGKPPYPSQAELGLSHM